MSIDTLVANLIRPEIRALQAYPVGKAEGMVKLDAMENPFRWPQEMVSEWQSLLADCALNRYPNPVAPEVVAGLREVMEVPEQYEVLLGNGSDEIIQLLAMALAKPGACVLAPEPGFVMYKMIATFVGVDYCGVPLKEDFSLDRDAMLAAIADKKPALVFLAQPNNPTGNLWAEGDLVAIIEACNAPDHQGLVVLDEAYLPFSSRNHLNWLDRFENVVVMRTLSKVGLAGLRLGMLFGRKEWLSELDKIRMPYNINVLTQASAAFALKHYVVLMQQCEILKAERTSMQQKLTQLGFSVFESEANFVLAGAPESATAREIFDALKQENILIKCTDGAHPLLANTLRFTVGAPEENSALFAALGRILNAD
ncbi:histidinol-phosphate transaminase [Thalassolituus sp.]|uniref:histidinol-phosphate transaminase n=1 Tax=Thalassolituus sp. TaxID=2030822 RepID=UPI003511A72B